MTTKEVNFEKRGKLEDHVECPVCKCCICWCGHVKLILLFLLFLLFPSLSLAQDTINYGNIKVLNTPIVDLAKNVAITDDELLNIKSGKKIADLVCPGSDISGLDNTVPLKVNDRRQVVGYCFQPFIGDVGFLRRPDGHYDFFQAPGSSSTFFFGVSENGKAVGQYFLSPSGYHGLLWDGTQLRTIDFPIAGAQTALLAVNNNGVALGAYFTSDPITNGASEWTCFITSNGAFFPCETAGARWFFPFDTNEEGLTLGRANFSPLGYDGGPGEPVNGEVYLEDDGVFKSLGFPSTVAGFEGFRASFIPRGINEAGQLGGRLFLISCPNPAQPFNCTTFQKGFIATEVKEAQGKSKK